MRAALRFVLLAFGALCVGIAAADGPSEPLLALRSGTVVSVVDGRTQEAPATLPYHWDRMQGGRPGEARFTLPFHMAGVPAEPWGLFIPRVGSAFDVALNGHVLQTYGDLARPHGADYAKAPIYLPIPAHLLQPGENLLRIRIRADSGRRAGLSVPTIGPAVPVRGSLFASAYAWRFTGSVLLSAFSIVVGAISLGLWFTQPTRPVQADRDASPCICGRRWRKSAGRCGWPTAPSASPPCPGSPGAC